MGKSTLAELFAPGQRIPELDEIDFRDLFELVLEEAARRELLFIDAKDAIERIQRMRDEAELGRKRVVVESVEGYRADRTDAEVEATYTDEMYSDSFDGPWDTYDAFAIAGETYDRVLDVLQLLARGVEPAQGAE